MHFRFNPITSNLDLVDTTSGVWGSITGTLSDQTDLQTALDGKLATAGGTMTGNLTMGTGLVLGSAGITRPNNTGAVQVFGGQDFQDGAYFNVTGKTYGTSPGKGSGEFVIGQDVTALLESRFRVISTDFAGGFTERLAVFGATGRVGVNTSTPGYLLDVNGTARVTSMNVASAYTLSSGGITRNNDSGFLSIFGGDDFQSGAYFNVTGTTYGTSPGKASGEFVIGQYTTSGLDSVFRVISTDFASAYNPRFIVRGSDGFTGIGTWAPQYRLDVRGAIAFAPGSSVTPLNNGDVVFQLTNNTTITVKAKGSDGTVRSGTITLA